LRHIFGILTLAEHPVAEAEDGIGVIVD